MVGYISGHDLQSWWFWAFLGPGIVVLFLVDAGFTRYCRAYHERRLEPMPENQTSYMDASRCGLFFIVLGVLAVLLATDRNWVGAALSAVGSVVFGWFMRDRARKNII